MFAIKNIIINFSKNGRSRMVSLENCLTFIKIDPCFLVEQKKPSDFSHTRHNLESTSKDEKSMFNNDAQYFCIF